jgi:hypothetical protein
VLLQIGPDDKWHPVAFDGRKLRGAELNYPVHEKELLAIKYALRTWNAYLHNNHRTEVVTDHESLKYMNTTRTPSKRLARWIAEFAEYTLDIRYRKGSEAVVPDAISRRPDFMGTGSASKAWIPTAEDQLDESFELHSLGIETSQQTTNSASEPTPQTVSEPEFGEEDTWEEVLMSQVRHPNTPLTEKQAKLLRGYDVSNFKIVDDILFRMVEGMYIPYIAKPLRKSFIAYYHRNYGHFTTPVLDGVIKFRGW